MPDTRPALVASIENLLPQTQCGKCRHPGCRPYAEAIADGEAINHCVPGGSETIAELAALLDRPVLPLDPDYGKEQPWRTVAVIREDECIGCTKCIQACPVDAILGAARFMHTVITADCTGCELCLPPCPVDCIDLQPLPLLSRAGQRQQATLSRQRFEARGARLERLAAEKQQRRPEAEASPATAATLPAPGPATAGSPSPLVAAALARTRLKKLEKQLAATSADDHATRQRLEADRGALQAELHALGQS